MCNNLFFLKTLTIKGNGTESASRERFACYSNTTFTVYGLNILILKLLSKSLYPSKEVSP